MHKTSVYLSEEDVERLALLADREGISQSEVIRIAIRRFRPAGRADRDFALTGTADGPGDSIADLDEEALLEGFGS